MATATQLVTRQEAKQAVETFRTEVLFWEDQREPIVQWQGTITKTISDRLQAAACSLIQFFDHLNFEPEAHEIVIATDRFRDALFAWANACKSDPNGTDPQGGRTLWHPYQELLESLKDVTYPALEPISQLMRNKDLQPAQIARMYGWYADAERTVPDTARVAEVAANPSKFDPTTWIHPGKRKRQLATATDWAKRCESFTSSSDKIRAIETGEDLNKPIKNNEPAPEPIEELLRLPGMTIPTVARMKHMSEDEVRNAAIACEIPLDPSIAAAISDQYQNSPLDRVAFSRNPDAVAQAIDMRGDIAAAKLDTYPEMGSVETRVLAMLDDGAKPAHIVRAMQTEAPALTFEGVCSIRNRKDEIMAAMTGPVETNGNATTAKTEEPKTEEPKTEEPKNAEPKSTAGKPGRRPGRGKASSSDSGD